MNYYFSVWQKYATFSGRARRAEYWYYQLFSVIAVIAIITVGAMMSFELMAITLGLYMLASFLPTIAVTVRRIHDIDFSGWWILLAFVPFGSFVLFIFSLMAGTQGPNGFGTDPITTESPTTATPTPVQPLPVVASEPIVAQASSFTDTQGTWETDTSKN